MILSLCTFLGNPVVSTIFVVMLMFCFASTHSHKLTFFCADARIYIFGTSCGGAGG